MRIIVNNIAASTGGAIAVLLEFYHFLIQDKDAQKIQWVFLLNDNYISNTSNIEVRVFSKEEI